VLIRKLKISGILICQFFILTTNPTTRPQVEKYGTSGDASELYSKGVCFEY
jgi:hypothetical protein